MDWVAMRPSTGCRRNASTGGRARRCRSRRWSGSARSSRSWGYRPRSLRSGASSRRCRERARGSGAPRGPHRLAGLRELPLSTLPLLRAPVIGTLLLASPERLAELLLRGCAAGGHVNLELHGIDALDATDGAPAELAALQPGLRAPAA